MCVRKLIFMKGVRIGLNRDKSERHVLFNKPNMDNLQTSDGLSIFEWILEQ